MKRSWLTAVLVAAIASAPVLRRFCGWEMVAIPPCHFANVDARNAPRAWMPASLKRCVACLTQRHGRGGLCLTNRVWRNARSSAVCAEKAACMARFAFDPHWALCRSRMSTTRSAPAAARASHRAQRTRSALLTRRTADSSSAHSGARRVSITLAAAPDAPSVLRCSVPSQVACAQCLCGNRCRFCLQ